MQTFALTCTHLSVLRSLRATARADLFRTPRKHAPALLLTNATRTSSASSTSCSTADIFTLLFSDQRVFGDAHNGGNEHRGPGRCLARAKRNGGGKNDVTCLCRFWLVAGAAENPHFTSQLLLRLSTPASVFFSQLSDLLRQTEKSDWEIKTVRDRKTYMLFRKDIFIAADREIPTISSYVFSIHFSQEFFMQHGGIFMSWFLITLNF